MRKMIIAAALGGAMLTAPLLATPAGASPAGREENPKASCASLASFVGGLGQFRSILPDPVLFGRYLSGQAQLKTGIGGETDCDGLG